MNALPQPLADRAASKAVVVGAGIVGAATALNLQRKGFTLTVYDLDPAAVATLAEQGAKAAGSVEPTAVLKALKSANSPEFVFGGGQWWGSQLWGQDNAVVGRWPVVVVEGGKARIKEYRSVSGWLEKNKDVLIKHMKELGLRTV